jgi:hypothetical protein
MIQMPVPGAVDGRAHRRVVAFVLIGIGLTELREAGPETSLLPRYAAMATLSPVGACEGATVSLADASDEVVDVDARVPASGLPIAAHPAIALRSGRRSAVVPALDVDPVDDVHAQEEDRQRHHG